jgi:hypothetical protein
LYAPGDGFSDCDHVVEIVYVVDDGVRFGTQACRRCGAVWTRDPEAPGRKPPLWRLVDADGRVEALRGHERWS